MAEAVIAMIDDNPSILYTVTEICKTKGIKVVSYDCYDALKETLGKNKYDMYLVDYHLPGRDGVDVVKLIRNVDKTVPIMMLTVESSETVATRVKEAGADDYALKPIKAVDFLSRLELHLKHRNQAKYYTDRQIGITDLTLTNIINVMKTEQEYHTVEELADLVGVNFKSLYRYLKYMETQGNLDMKYQYDKPGRPKTLYKWKE